MKNKVKAANLKAYQAWYEKYIAGKWSGWHRPGGEEGVVSKHKPSPRLYTESEATARLNQLGFTDFDPVKRQITLNGKMTNGVSGVCSYLVTRHKWGYVLPAETGGQYFALTLNRRYGVPAPIPA